MKRCIQAANRMVPKPRFFVVCGDLIDAMPSVSFRWEQVRDYKAVFSELDPNIRPICVCGNHDVGDIPTPQSIGQYITEFGDDYFTFWVGGVKFLVINSQYYADSTNVRQLQREHDLWLDEQLSPDHKHKWKHLVGFQVLYICHTVIVSVVKFLFSYLVSDLNDAYRLLLSFTSSYIK